jgi:hypothetical protein
MWHSNLVYAKTWAIFPMPNISVAVYQSDQYIAPMQENLKQQVLDAFLLLMRPIVRILLRYGIGYREFLEVTKTAYVDVASSDFGLRGRPTNISRVAVMTGLTRKEVKRLRDKIASGESRIEVKTTPLADVLHHWHAQGEYTDADGSPLTLPFTGESNSFSSLVKKFGGDIPAGAMRTEMKRVGVISEDEDGRLSVVNRAFNTDSEHERLVTSIVHGAYSLLSNIAHNTQIDRTGPTWANRTVYTQSLAREDSAQLRRVTKDRIAEFAESIDDIFIAYEALHDGNAPGEDGDAIAVGVFYFEETDENAKYDW